MTYCVLFIIYINRFICFPSLSFSFKFCVQLCDDVCGVQVVNYSMDWAFKMNCKILNPKWVTVSMTTGQPSDYFIYA